MVIDDAGHSVNVQRPTEVAELIRDFTAQPTPG
jgi:pimeloyl-ACP methyl ester carboxylesterase